MTLSEENRRTGKDCIRREEALSEEEIRIIKKVKRIVSKGKNVEIRRDKDGKLKLLQVSREIV